MIGKRPARLLFAAAAHLVIAASLMGPVRVDAASAFAQSRESALDSCLNNSGSAETRVSDCTAIIANGAATADVLSVALYNRGSAYVEQHDQERALADFSEAIRLNPHFVDAHRARARIYFERHDKARMQADYLAADTEEIAKDPTNGSRYAWRGNTYSFNHDYERAVADYTKAIELNYSDVGVFNNRGLAYEELNDYSRALGDFNEAIRRNPQYGAAYINRALLYTDRREYALALRDFNEAIGLNFVTPDVFFHRGLTYEAQGDFARAIADFDEAIRLDEHDAKLYAHRCLVRGRSNGDLDLARKDCDKALRLDSQSTEASSSRGFVDLKQQRWQEAWTDYDAAIRTASPWKAANFYGRGIAALRLRRVADGQADIARAKELDSQIAKTFSDDGIRP